MPNHYGNTLICQTGDGWLDEDGNEHHRASVVDAVEKSGLVQVAMPMSDDAKHSAESREKGWEPAWYLWAMEHWGTKWGAYSGKYVEMEADGGPPLITFNTAWRPPSKACRVAVRDWLRAHGVIVHLWVGSDPYDDSTRVIEDWTGADE